MMDASAAATLMVNNTDSGIRNSITSARAGALSAKKHMTDAEMETVAKDFESMFISQMLSQMFGDSVGSSLFGSDETKEIYKTMMVDEYGKRISQMGGIGIASFVKRELLAMQEVSHDADRNR